MYYKSSGLLLSALLIGGCGGGSGEDFTLADGFASYTGVSDLAYLDEGNSGAFLSTLYGPGLDSPTLNFRAADVDTGSVNDLNGLQGVLLIHIRQSGVMQRAQYQQRVVEIDESDDCEGGGKIDMKGDVDDIAKTAKLRLDYVNCQIDDDVINGKALALLAVNGSFDQLEEVTLSYHGLESRSLSSGETIVATGTVKESENLNSGALSNISKLHRQIKGTDQQSFIDLVNEAASINSSVAMSGTVYQGFYGRAQVSTLQRLVYDDAVPMSGQILMVGAEDSKLRVTALGQQYNEVTDETGVMLQVEVDEDGDGNYESQSLINTDDL